MTKHRRADFSADLQNIRSLIEREQRSFIDQKDDLAKRVGYFCAYTPPEILNAAGVRHARLFKAGNPTVVAHGERYTQSVFCDFSKSCIGGFNEKGGDPFYQAVDKVYNFHTCASMKRASEVIADFIPTKLLNLPRLRSEPESRKFFRNEIAHFRDDLAEFTGKTITDDQVSEQIVLFNQARRLIKKLSELRKRNSPPLSGSEFLDLARGFYYLPPEVLIEEYQKLYDKISKVGDESSKKLRLMISGSIVADGDRRLLALIEEEIGANVVVEDHCTGLKPFYKTIAEGGDPFEALANGYLDQAPCARMKPLEDSIDFSGTVAQEYAVDGVVYVYLKFCACYGVTKKEFLLNFQNIGIPVVEISSDYSQSDHGQLKTRVEAFVEVLNETRGDRVRSFPKSVEARI